MQVAGDIGIVGFFMSERIVGVVGDCNRRDDTCRYEGWFLEALSQRFLFFMFWDIMELRPLVRYIDVVGMGTHKLKRITLKLVSQRLILGFFRGRKSVASSE